MPTVGWEIPPSDIYRSLLTAIGNDPKLVCGGSKSEDDSDTRGLVLAIGSRTVLGFNTLSSDEDMVDLD